MARIGFTQCGCCGNPEAAVSRTATGTLSITCHKCEFSGFAKNGTRAHRLVTAALTLDDDAQESAPPKGEEKQPPKETVQEPKPAQRSKGFSLDDL
jgi:hypothetical protein